MSTKLDAGALGQPLVSGERALERTWNGFLLPALATALVISQIGYIYQGPNDALLEPWVLRLSDPGLLTRDWFANTIPHHANYVHFLAWISQLVPLPAATLAIQLLSVFGILWMAQRFSARLFGDWRVFYVAVFLFLRWGTAGLGGNSLWADYPVPHSAALPFCLLAFYLSLSDQLFGAALAAAAATWIHIQLGALTMLVVGVEIVARWALAQASRKKNSDRTLLGEGSPPLSFARIAAAGAVYAIAVAPTLLRQWPLYVSAPSPLSPRQFLALHAILRQPHHLIPSSWAGAEYYRFALLLGMAALAGAWRERPHRTVLLWFLVIAALCLLGTVFVELAPVKLVIKLQTFRMTVFVKFFAVIYTARFLLNAIEVPGAWTNVWTKLCALAILAVPSFTVIGICALLIVAARQTNSARWSLSLLGAGCIAGIGAVATANLGRPIPLFWHSFAMTPGGMKIALLGLCALAAVTWLEARLLAPALIALSVVLAFTGARPGFSYDHPPMDDWYQFCQQVKLRTPKDAVFVTPPVLSGFQFFAERAEVADFKCTPSIERDLIEWKRRMNDQVGYNLVCSGWDDCGAQLAGGYMRLGDTGLLALARKYKAQYVVAEPGQHLGFPVEFQAGDFTLYRVPQF